MAHLKTQITGPMVTVIVVYSIDPAVLAGDGDDDDYDGVVADDGIVFLVPSRS